MRELAVELLEFVDDVVDELGSRKALQYVHRILAEGTAPTSSSRCSGDGDLQPSSSGVARKRAPHRAGEPATWAISVAEGLVRTSIRDGGRVSDAGTEGVVKGRTAWRA
jgi:hypothetical protein